MDLESIKITSEALDKIYGILANNYGTDLNLKSMSEENLLVFIATAIEASYKIGFVDGNLS